MPRRCSTSLPPCRSAASCPPPSTVYSTDNPQQAFDLDRIPGAPATAALDGYRAIVAAVPVLEVAGRVDFRALVGAVAAILAG